MKARGGGDLVLDIALESRVLESGDRSAEDCHRRTGTIALFPFAFAFVSYIVVIDHTNLVGRGLY